MGWDAAAGLTAGRAPSLNVSSSPSAASSQNAANADKVDGLDVGCPSGTVLASGACFETQKRPASSSLSAAMSDCADEGRYSATLAQLVALQAVIFPGLGLEYTSSIFSDGGFKLFPS